MNRTIVMLRLAVGASFLLPVYSASAQTGTIIEEMVVTAQRREQSLQDTPVSVTAFSGDAVEKLGMRQSVDITAQTPNFSVGYPNGDTGIPALFIRGVGLSDFRVFTPAAIAPYADDVYIAQNAGQIFQLLDMERVEVLRGPQGTLYGRNATGGAVNYISKKPTEELEGWARASGGQYGNRKFEGAVSGPLSDRVGARVAVLKNDSDGWMKNRFTGHDQQGVDEFAARALVQADASDSVDLLLNVHGGYTKSDSVQYRHLGVWDAGGAMCPLSDIRAGQCVDIFGYSERFPYTTTEGVMGPDARDYDQGNYDLEKENDTKFWGLSLTANADVGDFVVTSITAYDDLDDSRPEET
ncbi:MAG: TonB-dependent receptor plug domain-containing protein, partial [Gammaproteobacteria bacterium]